MDDEPKPFAQWLNATMQSRGLTQADVAREMGVADAQVSRWRRGHVTPSVRSLHQLSTTFDVPRAQLERMAGYPMTNGEDEIDPELAAEMEAYQARFRRVMEEKLPPELWSTYLDACEAMAERLRASFQTVVETAEEEIERSRGSSGRLGFRT